MAKAIRVFIADGHETMRDALRALISTSGDMEVVGDAASGALIAEAAIRLRPDIVLLDIKGFEFDDMVEVIKRVRKQSQSHILVLTNETSKNELSAAVHAGAEGCLPKGVSAVELLQAIRDLHLGHFIPLS